MSKQVSEFISIIEDLNLSVLATVTDASMLTSSEKQFVINYFMP